MNSTQPGWEVMAVLLGGVGLVKELSRLATAPLSAVFIILGAMAFLLFPAASLCGTEIRRQRSRNRSDEITFRNRKTE